MVIKTRRRSRQGLRALVAIGTHHAEVPQTTQVPAMPPAVMQTGVLAFLLSYSPLVPSRA
ncbi:hypothetical protein BVG81_003475 [Haliangium sp. UPWRP_2]|nr:hypothetical protein BVG81_003475 [Haliangium sp. UPWRP_2]